jgi:hypothetical protein
MNGLAAAVNGAIRNDKPLEARFDPATFDAVRAQTRFLAAAGCIAG